MTYINIKKAALKLFAQKGFEGTTIKDIATECGLKPSSVYSHITSKEALFLDLFHECIFNILENVNDLKTKVHKKSLTDPKEILYLYFTKLIEHFLIHNCQYLYLKQASFFMKNYHDNQEVNAHQFLVNENTINYFKPFFIKLQQDDLIVQMDYPDLFYMYSGTIIAYLEEKLIYRLGLNDSHIDIFWNMFWQSISK